MFSSDLGRLAENIVFLELIRRGFEIYYWKGKKEVGFIAKKDGRNIAVNVCYTDMPAKREIESLEEIRHIDLQLDRYILITKDSVVDAEGIYSIPLWQWLIMDEI
ncbi:MAG: ATP-binding protein [Nitrospirae bacterium]|nr:MAG: ATP-binding protein [Nitrospirota bacterium]